MELRYKNKKVEFKEGTNLLEIMTENKIEVDNHCNGKGTCGKCKVRIKSNCEYAPKSVEKKFLTEEELNSQIRLACQIVPVSDLEIETVKEDEKSRKILTSGFIPDFEKDNTYRGYGVAIDIGTTTIALSLTDMETHEELFSASILNPQKKYGMDVLTRITYSIENEDGLKNLQEVLVQGINEMIEEVCESEGKAKGVDFQKVKENIKEIAVSANCTMTHTLLGKEIKSLGRYPYEPVFRDVQKIFASEIGIDVDEKCILWTLPQVSAFIGADIVAGAYVCNLGKKEKNTLFIDIGTNGEIVLAKDRHLMCCSCAAGPALEGMNIKYGMRAQYGAIEDIIIEQDGNIKLKVIGDKEATGICGSGILASVRELLKSRLVKPRGAFLKLKDIDDSNPLKKLIGEEDGKRNFIITEKVSVTQQDIIQVQLAKAAILSGFISLLRKAEIDMKNLDEVLIAGQFGSYLPEESLLGVGILPREVKGKIVYMGNTSKTGAYMFLTSKKVREEMSEIAEKMDYYELSTMKDYDRIFTKSLIFK